VQALSPDFINVQAGCLAVATSQETCSVVLSAPAFLFISFYCL